MIKEDHFCVNHEDVLSSKVRSDSCVSKSLSNQDLARTMTFGETGYVVLVDNDGHVLAHPDVKRMNEDLSAYTAVREARQGRSGWAIEPNRAGVRKLFVYRPVPNPGTVNARPWAVIAEMDEGFDLTTRNDLASNSCFESGLFWFRFTEEPRLFPP